MAIPTQVRVPETNRSSFAMHLSCVYLYFHLLLCPSVSISPCLSVRLSASRQSVCISTPLSGCPLCGCYIYRGKGGNVYIKKSRHFALHDRTKIILIVYMNIEYDLIKDKIARMERFEYNTSIGINVMSVDDI